MADWIEGFWDELFTVLPPVGILNVAAAKLIKLPASTEIGDGAVGPVSGRIQGSIPIKTIRFYPEGDDG